MSNGLEVLMPADIRFPLERANGVQIVKTAAALARAGARTTLLVRQSDPRPTPEVLALYGLEAPEGLTVKRVRVLHRKGSFTLPRLAYLARAVRAAAGAVRRGAVVFTRDLQVADLVLRLPGSSRVVYEAHAVESLMYQERSVLYGTQETARPAKAARLYAREGRVWRRAAGFVTTTAGIRDTFTESYGERARTDVVPNGCDVPQDRKFPGLPTDEPPRVLYAGQLYPWKGVDVLVQAMAALPEARLVVVGGLSGEPDHERVRRLVEAHGMEARTEMRGHIPQAEVAHELRRARVVVVPFLKGLMTERHTSPLKAFEAMAAGRPLVVSDLPSSREFLRPRENALLVTPGDAAALAAAIRELLADAALAERLARQAYEEAPRFSWDARARALVSLFEAVAR
jgi:glycosyltransferase involved in cell wall biosynthesis